MIWNGDRAKALMSGFESRRSLQLYIVSCEMIEPRCAERWQVRPDEQFDLVVISQLFYIVQNNSYLCIGVGTSVDVGNPSGVGIVYVPEFAQHGQPTCSMQV